MSGFPTQAYQMSLTGRQLNPSPGGSAPSIEFASRAELEEYTPDDGEFALLNVSGAGARVYLRSSSTWQPADRCVWTVNSSGVLGERLARSTYQEVIEHGDLVRLSDGNMLYAALSTDRQVVLLPEFLAEGKQLGVDIEANVHVSEIGRDPRDRATSLLGEEKVDYDDTVAGKTHFSSGTSGDDIRIAWDGPPNSQDAYAIVVLGVQVFPIPSRNNPNSITFEMHFLNGAQRKRLDLVYDGNALIYSDHLWWTHVDAASGSVFTNYRRFAIGEIDEEQDIVFFATSEASTTGVGSVFQNFPSRSNLGASELSDSFTGYAPQSVSGSSTYTRVRMTPNDNSSEMEFFGLAFLTFTNL